MHFPKSTEEYKHFIEWSEPWGSVYGPIRSRRLGLSLGVNLLGPKKVCSFNCPYCEVGKTEMRINRIRTEAEFPKPIDVADQLRVRLRELNQENQKLDTICVAGNGEPTLYPEFEEFVSLLTAVRDELVPGTPLSIFTNGTALSDQGVLRGLKFFENKMIKLDAGNDEILKVLNAPLIRTSSTKIVSELRQLEGVTIQSIFIQGTVDNTEEEHVEDWMELLGLIHPKNIHLYALNRVPPESGLKKVDEKVLYRISNLIRRRLNIVADVFP